MSSILVAWASNASELHICRGPTNPETGFSSVRCTRQREPTAVQRFLTQSYLELDAPRASTPLFAGLAIASVPVITKVSAALPGLVL